MRGREALTFSGAVQGVGFRWRARRLALRHGLAGWVRNNPDGTVSMEIEGEDADRAAMLADLAAEQEGLPFRRTGRDEPPAGYGAFEIRED